MPDATSEEPPVCYAMSKFFDKCGFLNFQPRSMFPLEALNFWQYVGRYPISAAGYVFRIVQNLAYSTILYFALSHPYFSFLINLTSRLISLETSHGE